MSDEKPSVEELYQQLGAPADESSAVRSHRPVHDVLSLLLDEPGLYRPFRMRADWCCERCGHLHFGPDALEPATVVLVRDESKRSERPFTTQACRCNSCGGWLV